MSIILHHDFNMIGNTHDHNANRDRAKHIAKITERLKREHEKERKSRQEIKRDMRGLEREREEMPEKISKRKRGKRTSSRWHGKMAV